MRYGDKWSFSFLFSFVVYRHSTSHAYIVPFNILHISFSFSVVLFYFYYIRCIFFPDPPIAFFPPLSHTKRCSKIKTQHPHHILMYLPSWCSLRVLAAPPFTINVMLSMSSFFSSYKQAFILPSFMVSSAPPPFTINILPAATRSLPQRR